MMRARSTSDKSQSNNIFVQLYLLKSCTFNCQAKHDSVGK